MLAAIKSRRSRQFEWAQWIPQGENKEKNTPKYIQVERVSERTNTFNPIGGNIVARSDKITLSTRYREEYKANDWVKYQGGMWVITDIREDVQKSPQALRFTSPEYLKVYTLELMKLVTERKI